MAIYNKYEFPWQSTSYDLIIGTASDVFEFTNNRVLESLKDNENYYLMPRYLRDMIISLWDSTAFKLTSASGSSIEYIGIDSGLADDLSQKPNRDLTINKLLIGKRSYSGTQSYSASHDIMSNALASSDVDIFFNNTRSDISDQKGTRIVFLAGTNPNLFGSAPYMQSQVASLPSGSQSLSLDIVNSSAGGNISVYSQGIDLFGNDVNIGGTVSINGISFPTMATSSDSSLPPDKKLLVNRNGELNWEITKFPQTDYIGITGSELNIAGSPTNINGHSLEFSDERDIPISIGNIPIGSNLGKMSIADVLKNIAYPYLGPLCDISLVDSAGYVEVGSSPNISLRYSITKRTNSTLPTKLTNMIPSTVPPISGKIQTTVSGFARGIIISPVTAGSSTFTIKANDGTSSSSATASITAVYPYFYGFTSSNTIGVAELRSMTKIVEPKGDKTFDLIGSGNFFFAYDSVYGTLSSIIDQNSIDIFATFSSTTKMLSSPDGLWTSKEYIIYKWSNVGQIGPPSENFDFKY